MKGFAGVIGLIVFLFLLTGCMGQVISQPGPIFEYKASPEVIELPSGPTTKYDPCHPPRGEEQDPEIRVHGQALNSEATGCI